MFNRRDFVKTAALAGVSVFAGFTPFRHREKGVRTFNLSTNIAVLNQYPEFASLIAKSGITDVWMPAFLNGYEPYSMEDNLRWKSIIEKMGIEVHALTVPFGHPNNSLGNDTSYDVTPKHWPRSMDINGKEYSGTSVHPIVTSENSAVVHKIGQAGFKNVFLDDDFRLARGPGVIGGCFCDWHKKSFTTRYGYGDREWDQMIADIKTRTLSSVVRDWVNYNCDMLTDSFRAQQEAAPELALGIMVMYLGSEKAGIRLGDYKNSLFRVGELMFEDRSFNPVKGKTDELFSVLFHRRFTSPANAFSETTAYPADKLSAANMAAKLHISTVADVRNTMYMSGLEPFPMAHWDVLAPAMKKTASVHRRIAGKKPSGPFKHYWGESSRMIGDDKPFSLFLATGVPFEVTSVPAASGWTFLSGFDARDVEANNLKSNGTTFFYDPSRGKTFTSVKPLAETLPDLFNFKKEIVSSLKDVPYVVEDKPVVCAWYPEIKSVLLWNLSETVENFTVRLNDKNHSVKVGKLDLELVKL